MLGSLAYGLGSLYSILNIPTISFIAKIIIIGLLLIISQICIDIETKNFTLKNFCYNIGIFIVLGGSFVVYNLIFTTIMKI